MILVSTDQCIKDDTDRAIIEKIRFRIKNVVCVEWQFPGLYR